MDDVAAVEACLAAMPEPHRALLVHVRSVIRAACPEAIETIYYGMPAFRMRGRMLLCYTAHRTHCSIYPASRFVQDALGPPLAPHLSGKATIRLTVDRPLPDELLRRIVEARIAEGTGPKGGR